MEVCCTALDIAGQDKRVGGGRRLNRDGAHDRHGACVGLRVGVHLRLLVQARQDADEK